MNKRVLMKGNEVIAEAAVRAGCRHYFGYPITPQSDILLIMVRLIVVAVGVMVQADS